MLRTTSQVLSYHFQLEETQSNHYSELAKRFNEHEETLNRLASENLRHRDMALRAYKEGVTDAFEVGFLAKPLNPDDYRLDDPLIDLTKVFRNEEAVIKFCLDVASSSSGLIPDLPETFERLVKSKKRRKGRLDMIMKEI